jgi:hypothetical protein
MMYTPPTVALISWGRNPEQKYRILARAGLLSARGLANPAAVIEVLELARIVAQSRRAFGIRRDIPPPPGTVPATDGLHRFEVDRLGQGGLLDPVACEAFDKATSLPIFDELKSAREAEPKRVPYTGEGALDCAFCWMDGLPPDSHYCGYCGYRLDEDGSRNVKSLVLDEGLQIAPHTMVRLIQAAVEPRLYRMVEDELDGRFGRYLLVASATYHPPHGSPYLALDEPLLQVDLINLSATR